MDDLREEADDEALCDLDQSSICLSCIRCGAPTTYHISDGPVKNKRCVCPALNRPPEQSKGASMAIDPATLKVGDIVYYVPYNLPQIGEDLSDLAPEYFDTAQIVIEDRDGVLRSVDLRGAPFDENDGKISATLVGCMSDLHLTQAAAWLEAIAHERKYHLEMLAMCDALERELGRLSRPAPPA